MYAFNSLHIFQSGMFYKNRCFFSCKPWMWLWRIMDMIYVALFHSHNAICIEHFRTIFIHTGNISNCVATAALGWKHPLRNNVHSHLNTRHCELIVLPKDTGTDWGVAGVEPPTLQSLDNWLYLLSYSPTICGSDSASCWFPTSALG